MTRFLTLLAFIGVSYVVGALRVPGVPQVSGTFFLGFLLLASYLAGRAIRTLALPQITGYLLVGILVGPHALGILTTEHVEELRFINGVALALIALTAGGELQVDSLRRRIRSIGVITLLQIVFMFAMVALAVYGARESIEFLRGQPTRVALAVALLFGLVAAAKSPATTIAVITEEKARGLVTETVLGITVLKDVLILVLIAVLIPLASAIVDPSRGFSYRALWEILTAILGSLVLGLLLGWLMTLYLRRVRQHRILFVLGGAVLSVLLGDWLHAESILIAMAAGFYVQNYSRQGIRLLRALEANSLPVYALFFAVAGADLDIGVLRSAWLVASAIVLTRLVALWASTSLGARLVGDPPVLRHHAWMAFVAQAGVTLGIANIVKERFPVWGAQVATVIIAMIAVNQLLGPPAFRWVLLRAGECHPSETSR